MSLIQESVGDIFSAPPRSVLLHACNCQGVWGAGVALEFKRKFPKAFETYEAHCNIKRKFPKTFETDEAHCNIKRKFPKTFETDEARCNIFGNEQHQESLLGTALVIPHFENDDMSIRNSPTYWIACLFTSIGYGRKRSSADVILASTQKAMVGLEDTLRFIKRGGNKVGDIWAVRLNSGKFGVNWERTKSVLEGCGMNLKVVNPAEKGSEGNLQGRLEGESTEQEHAGEEAGGIANVIGDGTLPIKTLKRKRGEHADTEAGGIANVFGDVAIPIRTLKRKRGT